VPRFVAHQYVHEHVERVDPARTGQPGDGVPDHPVQLGVGDPADLEGVHSATTPWQPSEPCTLQVGADPGQRAGRAPGHGRPAAGVGQLGSTARTAATGGRRVGHLEISGVTHTELDGVVGHTIAWLAGARGVDPFDVFVDVLVRDDLGTGILHHVGHEENVRTIMRHPRHTAGSDGILVGGKPTPGPGGPSRATSVTTAASWGCSPWRSASGTSPGGRRSGWGCRPRLVRPGYAADLVLFDPDGVVDTATYDRPRSPAAGIPYVLVNGELAMDDSRRTRTTSGGRCAAAARGGPVRSSLSRGNAR